MDHFFFYLSFFLPLFLQLPLLSSFAWLASHSALTEGKFRQKFFAVLFLKYWNVFKKNKNYKLLEHFREDKCIVLQKF